MLMKFSYATFLALASTSGADAFLAPPTAIARSKVPALKMVGGWDNEDFLKALQGGNPQQQQPEEPEPEEVGEQGGSRLKEILAKAAARQPEPSPQVIMNPFLEPPPVVPPANLQEMSVEEQARMFREMMQNGGPPAMAPGAVVPPPLPRPARASPRPVGRNRDADSIANTADLYFAQLKRDSTVRGIARLTGDAEKADQVFADEGIKELEKLVSVNPYLKGLREKEQNLIDTIPEEMLAPYFDNDSLPEEEKNTAGVSYKDMLKQRRQGKAARGQAAPAPPQAAVPPPVVVETAPPVQQQAPPQTMSPPEPVYQPPPAAPVQSFQQQSPVAMAPPQSVPVASTSSSSDPEETKRKMRTLMGMILKHRGGPGFGKGRLKGGEIDQFDNLLQEVTALLREEAAKSTAASPAVGQPAIAQQTAPQMTTMPAATATPAGSPTQLDSMIACIEGAITMYKNSPAELKSSVLVTLRAAFAAAISTCDSILGYPDPSPGVAVSQVDGTIAVIEGAISLYRNSPPELRNSVVFTLRAALRSSVNTCDLMLGAPPAAPVAPQVPAVPAQTQMAPAAPVQPTLQQQTPAMVTPTPTAPEQVAPIPATDVNSKTLDKTYNNLKAAHGQGSLGLRSDLTSQEASELADQLVEMRGLLMEELDSGIPDPEEPTAAARASAGSTTVSKYQEMLAKAKAEKAGNA